MAEGRWFTMTLAEQLGNVGSDFERALKWKEKNHEKLFQSASSRMLELLDLTIDDPRWHNHRLTELVRLREQVCHELFTNQAPSGSAKGLQKYFLAMATLARANHS